MTARLSFTPVIIIGAGRSGTNALRDALTRLPSFATWPCDEINPIWRHGNLHHPNDELTRHHAIPAVRSYIRRAFARIWREQGQPAVVVEKTCANTLRVDFVDEVLPEARFIHIVRDGVDVVASAQRRWRGDLEVSGPSYFLSKARYAPLSDLPVYAWSFLRARLTKGRTGDLGTWGPRFSGSDALAGAPLGVRVAAQWVACVTAADAAFAKMDPARVLYVRYEDFAADPNTTLLAIVDFLGHKVGGVDVQTAAAPIRTTSVGKGHAGADVSDAARAILAPTLKSHGYEA